MNQQISEQQLIQLIQREESILQSQQQFFQNIKTTLRETHETIESLKEIQNKPQKIFFKLGIGVLIEAELKNSGKCKRAFSETGFKEEKIEDTIKWLEKRKINLETQAGKIQTELFKTEQKINEMINIAQQIQIDKNKNVSVK